MRRAGPRPAWNDSLLLGGWSLILRLSPELCDPHEPSARFSGFGAESGEGGGPRWACLHLVLSASLHSVREMVRMKGETFGSSSL